VDVITAAELPAALAISEDGTLFLAYGRSRVRVVRNREVIGDEPLASGDGDVNDGPAIVDVALDPQFPRTRHLYVLEVLPDESPTFRVSRFREAAGRLGERAVLLDRIPARRLSPTASLAFGGDGRLYIGFDDGDDEEEAQRLASYSGKVVRLNADGTAPSDQRNGRPVHASDFGAPVSLSWDTPGSSLWVADQLKGVVRRLGISAGARSGDTTYTLAEPEKPRSIAIYRSGLIPELRGNLLVTMAGPHDYLLRARLTPDESALSIVERLTIPGGSPVRLVETSPGGALYVATSDAVMRLAPW
jgi:glucose/arabinose dehydrogenase